MALVVKDTGSIPTHKTCNVCKDNKPLSDFHICASHKYGRSNKCKVCKSIYKKAWYEIHKDERALKDALWSKNNLDKKRAYRAKRRAAINNRTPKWVDIKSIQDMYKKAHIMSLGYGVQYEVDHIIPLQGKKVSGLHTLDNLQIISMFDNRKKAYKFEVQ